MFSLTNQHKKKKFLDRVGALHYHENGTSQFFFLLLEIQQIQQMFYNHVVIGITKKS